jgi:hypothetical protein
VWPYRSLDPTPLDDFFYLGGGIYVKEILYTPQYVKISRSSQFEFEMLVNQQTCKCTVWSKTDYGFEACRITIFGSH